MHTTRAEEEIAETFELEKKTAESIQVCIFSALLLKYLPNVYQKMFERRATHEIKNESAAANNYVKKGRKLHLNLTLNVKVTVKDRKKHTRVAVDSTSQTE